MDVAVLKRTLAEEGFPHIYEWEDSPGTEYSAHTHEDKVTLYILKGGLTFRFDDGEEITLRAGARYDVAPRRKHEATISPEGCHFLVGEMVEGDS